MSDITDSMGLIDNGDGTYSDPGTPGILYDENGYATGTVPGYDYAAGPVNATATPTATETPPAGAVRTDSTGTNWLDAVGNVLGPVLRGASTPYLADLYSGGLLSTGTDMLKSAGNALAGVSAPDLTRLIPQLQLQVMQGEMTPAQAAAVLQQASEMNRVQTDVASLQGQRQALGQLEEIGRTGMTEADRAALTAAMNQAAAKTASDRAAQLQQLQMQGNAGTGAELAARLSGIQGGANANAMAGAEIAKAQQARALQAIQAGLQGNAALNTQQFEQAASKARAQDQVNQFNAQAQNAINQTNAALAQQSNLANFNMANEIAKTNVGIQNQAAMMPLQTTQQTFQNQLDLGKARSNVQVAAGTPIVNAAQKLVQNAGTAAGTAQGGTTAGSTSGGRTGGSSGGGGGGIGSTIGGLIGNSVGGPIGGAIGSAIGGNISGVGDFLGNIGSGISDAVSGVGDWLGGLFSSDEDLKTGKRQLTDDEVDKLMAHMTAYKYRYKGDPMNPERAGVMAQDLEKGGSTSVVNTPAGKMIQGPNMMSEALAVLANQHERIKKLEGKE